MTTLQKAIMTEIKAHIKDRFDTLGEYGKAIKFHSMGRYDGIEGDDFAICFDGNSMVSYKVECTFKPAKKWDNNLVIFKVNLYSNGDMGIYFDGTSYFIDLTKPNL